MPNISLLIRCVKPLNSSEMWYRIGDVSQGEALIPGGVEATFDGLGLLLALTLGIWDQLELDVGV